MKIKQVTKEAIQNFNDETYYHELIKDIQHQKNILFSDYNQSMFELCKDPSVNFNIKNPYLIYKIWILLKAMPFILLDLDDSTKAALINLGFKQEDFIHIASIHEIVKKIKEINAKGNYVIVNDSILKDYQLFIGFKSKIIIMNRFGPYSGKRKVKLNYQNSINELQNIQNKINYGSPLKDSSIDLFKLIFNNEIFELLVKEEPFNNIKPNFISFSKSLLTNKLYKILVPIFTQATFHLNHISERKKYLELYDLFVLLAPERFKSREALMIKYDDGSTFQNSEEKIVRSMKTFILNK